MLVYLLMLLLPAVTAVMGYRNHSRLAMLPLFLFFTIVIGFRHKIGMDWNNYLAIQFKLSGQGLVETLFNSEPGYALLARWSEMSGWGVYGTNVFAAIVFTAGLFAIARRTVNPSLAIISAVPYLVVVIAMSATRQAIAIGFVLLAVASWNTSGIARRSLWLLLASLFHFSALFLLGMVMLGQKMTAIRKVIMGVILLAICAQIISSANHVDYYMNTYFSDESELVQSSGALAHVLMIAVPGAIYLWFRKRWPEQDIDPSLLVAMSWLGLAALIGVQISSTAVDRMSLYLYAVPLVVWSAVPELFSAGAGVRLARGLVVFINFSLLYVWLKYANSAFAYLPYKNILYM